MYPLVLGPDFADLPSLGDGNSPRAGSGLDPRHFFFRGQVDYGYVVGRAVGGEQILAVGRQLDSPGSRPHFDAVQQFIAMSIQHGNRPGASLADVELLAIGRDPNAHRS